MMNLMNNFSATSLFCQAKWSIGHVMMIEPPIKAQIATDTSIDATCSAPAITKGVGPSSSVVHKVAKETHVATNASVGSSSQVDVDRQIL